jgi:type II secretory pathway component GspD/PulD (secretin)
VRLKPGEPTLVDSYQTSADKQATGEFVIVTAQVDAEGAKQAAEGQGPRLQVFQLANAQAQDMAVLLNKTLDDKDLRIAVDAAGNRIIAHGAAEQLEIVRALLLRLDESK